MTQDRMWPRWVPITAAGFALLIAVLSPFTHVVGPANGPVMALLVLSVLPWVVETWRMETGRGMLPRAVFALGVFAPLALLNLGGEWFGVALQHDGQLSFMLVTVAAGELAASVPTRRLPIYGAAAVLMPFGRFLVEPRFTEWVFWAAGILLAIGAGLLLQRQNALVQQLRAAQGALAEEAAVAERQRIAREVHDVIAHSLTVSMLHITAARLAVRRDPGEAEAALADAERLGRQALNDVRRTVGLLHEGTGSGTARALPGATDVPALVESYAAAGVDVRFECTAELGTLSPAGGLALYRAVQEGLSNATKHAPGAAVAVSIRQHDGSLVAEVTNPYDAAAGRNGTVGLGLRGMRERVEAVGGTVAAGPRDDGWVTTCAVPLQATT
jgi:signal transduction histidine kinase